ncbi:MAG: AAA family ATPase, partial [Bacteroidota bacterium]
MELIHRFIYDEFIHQLKPGRVLLLFGARRVGKTHLLRKVTASFPAEQTLVLNGEDQQTIDA